jgi:hypothetical protein
VADRVEHVSIANYMFDTSSQPKPARHHRRHITEYCPLLHGWIFSLKGFVISITVYAGGKGSTVDWVSLTINSNLAFFEVSVIFGSCFGVSECLFVQTRSVLYRVHPILVALCVSSRVSTQ